MKNQQIFFRVRMKGGRSLKDTGLVLLGILACLLLLGLSGCASKTAQPAAEMSAIDEPISGEPKEVMETPLSSSITREIEQERSLPVRFKQPSYLIKDMQPTTLSDQDEQIIVQVGADISTTTGTVPLRDIIKRLAALKSMNVSWASDINQRVLIDVDIRAQDDFFEAIDNLLRQVDYYHEVKGNTIVVKYKETKKFHIAMPPRLESIDSASNAGSANESTQLTVDKYKDAGFNRWDEVRENLDKILEIWTTEEEGEGEGEGEGFGTVTTDTEDVSAEESSKGKEAAAGSTATSAAIAQAGASMVSRQSGKGYYMINEDIGLITVTAPRPLLEKISGYIENIKFELYRQISIEAKIVEVSLDNSSNTGLDWSSLFKDRSIAVNLFDGTGQIYPRTGGRDAISSVNIGTSFDVVLNAIAEQGETKVLANPKISVMNGQPAVIYVGDNVTYIDKVTTTVSEGIVSTSVTTAQATSGIRLEVYPTIINENEIILSLTPLISGLNKEIEYRTFGSSQVGLPEIRERAMNSIVRVKDGQMLVVGGLIDRANTTGETKVRFLGDIPIISKFFTNEKKGLISKELVILLRPRII